MTATPPRLGGGNVPSYDAIAEEYAEKFFDELDGKPFDREVLDRFAASVKDRTCVRSRLRPRADRALSGWPRRRRVRHRRVGVDGRDGAPPQSDARLPPGDFFSLPLDDGALAGVAAFYCLIHCARAELGRAVAEIHRVLIRGGRLLMTVHAGDGEVGRDEAYGKRVALVATLFSEDEVRAALTSAGFRIDELVTREPYPFEYQSRRIYATATRQEGDGQCLA
jgi:SAM-dependent methyltransferase